MVSCSDMRMGEVYSCKKCGIELQVVKECGEGGQCTDNSCTFTCCDEDMKKKS